MKKERLFLGQIQFLNNLTGRLSVKQLSVKSIQALLKLQKELNEKIKSFYETQDKLMEAYGLRAENGRYNFEGHKDKYEIGRKLSELTKQEIQVSKDLLNFMPEDELMASAKEVNVAINELSLLLDLLVKKEPAKTQSKKG